MTGCETILEINPDLNLVAHQHKVCPETQNEIYNDTFFGEQQIVVNALDNVEARRYVDGYDGLCFVCFNYNLKLLNLYCFT